MTSNPRPTRSDALAFVAAVQSQILANTPAVRVACSDPVRTLTGKYKAVAVCEDGNGRRFTLNVKADSLTSGRVKVS